MTVDIKKKAKVISNSKRVQKRNLHGNKMINLQYKRLRTEIHLIKNLVILKLSIMNNK